MTIWDYPPKGKIIASCGHPVHDTGECVEWRDWDEFGEPCVMGACYCPPCALKLKVSGYYIAEPTA